MPGNVDRLAAYRRMRRRVGGYCYVQDIDQVEYRMRQGMVVPVALLELTRINGGTPGADPAPVLDAIINRVYTQTNQARASIEFARRLGVPPYLIAYDRQLTRFFVHELRDADAPASTWTALHRRAYIDWLRLLGR